MWCPKCKVEYQDGIRVCADCGTELVEGTAEEYDVVDLCDFSDREIAEEFVRFLEYSEISGAHAVEKGESIFCVAVPSGKEKQALKVFHGFMAAREQKREEALQGEDIPQPAGSGEESSTAGIDSPEEKEGAEPDGGSEAPDELLYQSSDRYVRKSEQYQDMKMSGGAFIIFGIGGIAYLVLCQLGVIPIQYNIIVFCIILVMFCGFFAAGISSVSKARKLRRQLPEEEVLIEEITKWLEGEVTEDVVDSWKDEAVSEAENDLNVMNRIRRALVQEYPQHDIAFLDYLAEEFFNAHYVQK